MHALTHSLPGRTLALALAVWIAGLGCRPGPTLAPSNGAPEYQRAGMIPVPGGTVNAAGGNLMIERLDMSIDTILGTQEIRAVYNAESGRWLWNFQVTYDGTTYVDPTGAVHDVSPISDGAAIPGTVYVKADADTIETKGGMAFHFDGSGQLSFVAWKTADYPRLEYTRTPTTLEIFQCPSQPACLPFYSIALNAGGDPLSVTDARTGRIADYQYDGLDRLVVARDALAVEQGWAGFQYEYSLGGTLLTAITNSEGERIEYVYQGNRRIRDVTQIGEGNPTHHFGYTAKDSADLYTTIHTNPLAAKTRYRIDEQRRLYEVELDETGEFSTLTWNGRRPSSLTLPGGVTTTLSYVDDHLASAVAPSGNVVTFAYEPGGLNFDDIDAPAISRIDDSIGLVQQRTYDAQGRVETISNGEGDAFTSTYTEATLASLTNPQGALVTFPLYGIHGHWTEMQGDVSDRRSLDPVGNVRVPSVERQQGGVLTRSYDAARNLAALQVASTSQGSVTSQGSISIARRSDGQLTSITRPGGADHDFAYDALGRLVTRRERADGVWQATSFEYDAEGHLISRSLPNGMREEFDYDGYGRRTHHRALRDGSLEGEAIFTYSDGQLVAFSDSIRNTTELYGYDAAGRLETILFGFGEQGTFQYDLRSRIAAEVLSWPGQGAIRRIDYAYDLADRRRQLTIDGAEFLAEWTYVNGEANTTQYGNGLTRSFSYDPTTGSMVASTTTNALAQIVEDTTVAHTAELAPPRQQITVQMFTSLASTEEQYWMGLGGSLATPDEYVGKRIFAWNDGNGASKSYDYDELSNLQSNVDGDTFGYNAEGNRLLSATLVHEGTSITYTYDEAGFATSRGGVPLTWTATGRMASFGPTAIEWDMRGLPISWTLGGITRDFVFFGGRVDSDPQTGALGSVDLGVVSIPFGSSERTYRHLDFRGNVSFVTDASGNIITHYRYSAYGLDAVFGAGSDSVRFVGRQEIGDLMLLGARMYDPAVGRFLSPDPVFQFINQHTYTLGNPVWFSDPDGRNLGVALGWLAVGAAVAVVIFPAYSGTIGVLAALIALLLILANGGLAVVGPEDLAAPSFAGSFSGSLGTGDPIGVNVKLDSTVNPGCSPVALAGVSNLRWALALLVPLQLLLGIAILRRRRALQGSRS